MKTNKYLDDLLRELSDYTLGNLKERLSELEQSIDSGDEI